MTFKEILNRLTGKRFCCSGGCCGSAYSRPRGACGEMEFDMVFVVRLLVSCVIFLISIIASTMAEPLKIVLCVLSVLVGGVDIIAGAVLSIMRGQYFDKCVLIILTAIIAFVIGESVSAVALVLLFQIGGVFIDYTFSRTVSTVHDAIDCNAETASVIRNGEEEQTDASLVAVGEQIIIRRGQTVPCDCIVLEGASSLDLSPLGGSAAPHLVKEGDELHSGSVNQAGTLRCEVTLTQEDSTESSVIKAVEANSARGSAAPDLLNKIVSWMAPALVLAAVVLMALLFFVVKVPANEAIKRALSFLVLANPCSMLIAAPLIRLGAMGGAAQNGILFSGCAAMDNSADADAVSFDKPGTLTEGTPRVVQIKSERMAPDVLLKICAHALAYSNSQQARSIIASYNGTIYIDLIQNFVEIPGSGVEVHVDGVRICAGSRDLMTVKGISVPDDDGADDGTAVYVAIANAYAGCIVLNDALRSDAGHCITELEDLGVSSVSMLTGESREAAIKTAGELGINEYYSSLTDEKRLAAISDIHKSCSDGHTMMYVGTREASKGAHTDADVDVALCELVDLSMPSKSDVTLFGDRIDDVASAIRISRFARQMIYACSGAALAVKIILLLLAGFGLSAIWFSAVIDTAAAVGAVLVSILSFGRESFR